MRRVLCALLLVAAIAIPSVLYATQGQRESVETRVAAFKHDNGNVEFAIQVHDGSGWSERILPETRRLTNSSPSGRWLVSSAVTVDLPGPLTAPEPEAPDGVRFDLAVTKRGDDLVIEAQIDGERLELPITLDNWDQNGDRWGRAFHQFAPNRVRNRETRQMVSVGYNTLMVTAVEYQDLGELLVTPSVGSAARWTDQSHVFTRDSYFVIALGSLEAGATVPLKGFTVNPYGYNAPIPQRPCTAQELREGVEGALVSEANIVAHAYDHTSCHVDSSKVIRRAADGSLYGTALGGDSCKYSVELIERTGPFARFNHIWDQNCEVLPLNRGAHYFVIREWSDS